MSLDRDDGPGDDVAFTPMGCGFTDDYSLLVTARQLHARSQQPAFERRQFHSVLGVVIDEHPVSNSGFSAESRRRDEVFDQDAPVGLDHSP